MKKLWLLFIPIFLLLGFSTANAAGGKIGVMKVQTIMQQAPQMVAFRASMKKRFQPQEQKIIALEKTLKQNMQKLQKDGPVMKDGDKKLLAAKVTTQRTQLMKSEIKFRGNILKAQNKGLKQFLDLLNKITKSVAKKGNYQIILRREGLPYVSASLDVTNKIMTALKKAA